MISVVTAYSVHGFLAWRFFFDTVNQHSIIFFVEHDVQPLLLDDNVVLADNAEIHKTPGALQVLNRVTKGRYLFNGEYYPFSTSSTRRVYMKRKQLAIQSVC